MGDLPKLYSDFGSEVQFEMVPFMYGSMGSPKCFDERSPCIEEQTAYCVIDIAQKADANSRFPGQDKVVPWQICHSKGNSMETCHAQVGIDSSEVSACLNDRNRVEQLVQQYISRASHVHGTPYEEVNGNEVENADYQRIRTAICQADPSACNPSPAPTPSPSPNCAPAALKYCCDVGTPCDCSRSSSAPGQCSW